MKQASKKEIKRKRVKKFYNFLLFIMIILSLVIILLNFYPSLFQAKNIKEVKNGKDLEIYSLLRKNVDDPNSSPIKIIGTYGDIFEPQIKGINRAYDMIVLSATLDPITKIDSIYYWQSNFLVRSFFSYAFSTEDEDLIQSGVKSLLEDMMRENKEYIRYFYTYNSDTLNQDKSKLVKLCQLFYNEIPKKSILSKLGINWYVVVPIFNSEKISDINERKNRLKLNVRTATERIITDGEDYREIRILAFPGLAGSEKLLDSDNYLTYYDSYLSIIDAFKSRELPKDYEKIYLVAWDKWTSLNNPQEGENAIKALIQHYNENFFRTTGSDYVSYFFLLLFGFSYLFWIILEIKKERIQLTKEDNSYFERYWRPTVIFLMTELLTYFAFLENIKDALNYFNGISLVALIIFELGLIAFVIVLSNALLFTNSIPEKLFKKKT